ncbi:hypothetical protein BDN72DRAFT_899071 [Pluteus cervinus]|uniref:Uncharacterized protein n=1 Tax=Pluteus cervinus TaxID=181527 RepID=A0ACD3ANP5_9AGAR|nr:hypothetical protein BDN72DRAFT_899071 [Pluteus cervinus]
MDINAILPPPVSPGDPPSNPNPLPNLREVWIQIPPTNWIFAEADWTSLLRFMAPKNYPIIALVFEDENQPGSLDFLQTPVDWFISQNHPVDATSISILLKPFECITDLVLPVRCFGFGQKRLPIHSFLDLSSDDEFVEEPSSMTDILRKTCAFVNCFSAVKKITANAKRYQTRFAPAKPPTEREIKVLVSQLKSHCPRIRELVVNEVIYSVQEIAI